MAGAFAVSPYAQFWGRSVMMESSAVFFGLLFVWAMARLRSQPHAWVGVVAIVAAVLSAAIKVTSFFGFAAFVALAFLWLALREHGWARNGCGSIGACSGVACPHLPCWPRSPCGCSMPTR